MVDQQLVEQISQNKATNRFHSVLLILAMASILSVVGYLLMGRLGLFLAIGLTIVSVAVSSRMSVGWVMRTYRAREILPHEAPALFDSFSRLSDRAGLQHRPKLFYIPSRMPNAFAAGSGKNSAVAVTDGLVRMMNLRELEGILGHELSHLMHRDTKVMSLADAMSRLTASACRIGFFLLIIFGFMAIVSGGVGPRFWIAFAILFFSPTLMILLQLALSRSREFNADLGAVQLTGDALGLASALKKLERVSASSSFWQRVLQPGQQRSQPAMLRTHPPTDERIRRLLEHSDHAEMVQQAAISPEQVSEPRRIRVEIPRVRVRPRYHVISGLWH